MKRSLLLFLMSLCSPLFLFAEVGDTFTAKTTEGWDMVFTILDEDAKTCQVGYLDGAWDKTAVDRNAVEDQEVTIPSIANGYTVIKIGKDAFHTLRNYTLTMPSSVTKIDNYAFFGDINLTLQVERTIPLVIDENVFEYLSNSSLRVPIGSKAAYAAATGWSQFENFFEGNEGSTFTAETIEGYEMVFTILDESAKTCQVGYIDGFSDKLAVDKHIVEGSLTIPDTANGYKVVKIGRYALWNIYKMTSVTIPNTVTAIAEFAFAACALTSFDLPASVTTIEAAALIELSELTSITVAEGNPLYDSREHCNALIETATNKLLLGCKNTIIPSSVFEIEKNAFYKVSNYSLTIPSTITKIDDRAFCVCKNLILKVEHTTPLEINDNAFELLSNSTLRVPAGCKEVYASATGWKNFGTIYEGNEGAIITAKTTEGWDLVFTILDDKAKTCQVGYLDGGWNKLAVDKDAVDGAVTIPETVEGYSVVKIGKYAFNGVYNMRTVTIPNTVTTIEEYAFSYCTGLTSIEIPASVTSLGNSALDHLDNAKSIIVAEDNKNYDSRDNCNAIIETASNKLIFGYKISKIPSTVTEIGEHVFYNLNDYILTIPSTITKIGDYAFSSNYNFVLQVEHTDPLVINENVFQYLNNSTLRVPVGSKAAYAAATGWGKFDNIFEGNEGTIFTAKTDEGIEMVFTILDESAKTCQVGYLDADGSASKLAVDRNAVNGAVTIPESVNGYTVVRIGKRAFENINGMTSVTIPNTVTSIGFYAFQLCNGLTSFELPASVTTIEECALSGFTSATSLKVAEGNPNYDSRDNCNAIIETATNKLLFGCMNSIIPSSVTEIGEHAFHNLGYYTLTIPSSITKIDDNAFFANFYLTLQVEHTDPLVISENVFEYLDNSTLRVPVGSKAAYAAATGWCIFDNIFEGNEGTTFTAQAAEGIDMIFTILDESTKTCQVGYLDADGSASKLAVDRNAVKGEVTIPSVANGYTVVKIGKYAFRYLANCTLTMPSSITKIDDYAFRNCNNLTLEVQHTTPLEISENVFQSLSYSTLRVPVGSKAAYASATGWKNFGTIYEGNEGAIITAKTTEGWDLVFTILDDTEKTCQVGYIDGSSSKKAVDRNVVNGSVTIPETVNGYTVVKIGKYALCDVEKMTSVTIPKTVTSIDDNAFWYCYGLTSFELPASVTSLGNYALSFYSNTTSIKVADGNPNYDSRDNCNAIIETATNRLLFGYKITTIPATVTEIGENAFSSLSDFTLTIPSTITKIDDYAFRNSSNLILLVKLTTPLEITENVFQNLYNSTLRVPIGSKAAYAAATGWSKFDNIFEGNEGVTFTAKTAEGIEMVFTILDETAKTCQVGYIDGSRSKKAVDKNVVYGQLTIPETVEGYTVDKIGKYAFYDVYYMTSVTIPNTVKSIDDYAFLDCFGLTSFELPASVTSLGYSALSGLSYVKSIKVADGNPKYDSRDNCNAIIETATNKLFSGYKITTIPATVTEIGESAFSNLDHFNLTIPSTITKIDNFAFLSSDYLTLQVERTTPLEIDYFVFYNMQNSTLRVPVGCKDLYASATGWKNFGTILEGNNGAIITAKTTEGWDMVFTVLDDNEKICQVGYLDGSMSITAVDNSIVNGPVTIPETVEGYTVVKIGKYAFDNVYNMTSVKIPNTVISIDDFAFQWCRGLTSFEIPASVTSIGNNAIYRFDSATSIKVAEGNPNYDSRDNCNAIIETATNKLLFGFKVTTIPATVTEIGEYAFGVYSTYTLTIPSTITKIDDNAFFANFYLTLQVEHTTPLVINDNVFKSLTNCTLRVPVGTKSLYLAADGWKNFGEENIIEMSGEKKGDVTGDGIVSVSDVVMIISYVLGENPSEFKAAAADVNGDGKVTIADIVMVIDSIKKTN